VPTGVYSDTMRGWAPDPAPVIEVLPVR